MNRGENAILRYFVWSRQANITKVQKEEEDGFMCNSLLK